MAITSGFYDEQTLMLYQAYMDGSGKLHDRSSQYVVLAGVVFRDRSIGDFAEAWTYAKHSYCKAHSLRTPRYVRAVEAAHQKGEFKGWNEEQITGLLSELAGVARDKCLHLFSVPVGKRDYEQLPDVARRKLGSLAEVAFHVLLSDLSDLVQVDKDHIWLYSDDEEKEAMEMYRLLVRYKQRHAALRDVYTAITFVDDKAFPAVQAADVLAYAVRRDYDKRATGGDSRDPVYATFTHNGRQRIEYAWDDTFNPFPRVTQ